MKAYDVIAYELNGGIYCPVCLLELSVEDQKAAFPMFCGEEVDSPIHCESCGDLIEDCSLTDKGCEYILRKILEAVTGTREVTETLNDWWDAFCDVLTDYIGFVLQERAKDKKFDM